MGLTIEPDPAHADGGHARLVLTDAADLAEGAQVLVSLLDPYSGRHLGAQGFQRDPVAFGPYLVGRDNGRAVVTLGPEIVNQVEEYAALRIALTDAGSGVARLAADVRWPDSIVPAIGMARIGGLVAPGRAAAEAGPRLVGHAPDAAPATAQDDTPPRPDPAPPAPDPTLSPAPASRPAWLLVLLGLATVGAVLAAVWALGLFDPDPVADPPRPETAPDPAPVSAPEPGPAPAPPDPCGAAALDALSGLTFADALSALTACGPAVPPDRALRLIEDAAVAGEAQALYLFGVIYDAETRDAGLETEIGVQLTDSAELAADYYARALAAGWAAAAVPLAAVCDRLAARRDTPAQAALRDHCGR